MSEFRQDPTNGEWVIIAPARGERPHARIPADAKMHRATFNPNCPFCPGNEDQLPAIIDELSSPDSPGWRTRVILNKFPVLSIDREPRSHRGTSGYGAHEVIIETPRHDIDLADMPAEDLEAVIETWHRRFDTALAMPGIEAVILFQNHGIRAGASLGHSHSQLVALPFVPPRLRSSLDWAQTHFQSSGKCVTCEEIERELKDAKRVVECTELYAVLTPFAAQSPFEQWIVPRRHIPSFSMATIEERVALGRALQNALRRLECVKGELSYNLVLEPGSPHNELASAAHWSKRVVPHLITSGGFELESGLAVNSSSPERDAQCLRTARAKKVHSG